MCNRSVKLVSKTYIEIFNKENEIIDPILMWENKNFNITSKITARYVVAANTTINVP